MPSAVTLAGMGASTTLLNPLRPGEVLDHYRIDTLVATSGMATIFRATDLSTERTVAIKLPHFEMESDPVFFDRFQREEAIGTTLNHPGVIKVFAEENRSRLYMVLEWVEGRLLRQVLNEQGKIPPERAVRMALQICDALDYVHGQGVVHRDLKPENIMVDADDRIKLIDFGIASKAGARRLTFGKLSKTQGTPEYISPEQVKGKRGDVRSDLYSLGVILYEMLTGETPFPAPDPLLVLNVKLHTDPPSPRMIAPELSPALEEIVLRAMERDPLNRYRDARELAWDLEHQDHVALGASAERRTENKQKAAQKGSVFPYLLLGLVPVFIFALLLYVAGHS
ncbi:MAG: serine/threonine-protein kinase [Terriglobia bacterium]